MKKFKICSLPCTALLLLVMTSCSKTEQISMPPEMVSFTSDAVGSYYVQNNPASVYRISVGATTLSEAPRTVHFSVRSTTGAAAGSQYELAGTSVVIPAGESVGTIELKGLFSGFPANRRDTLILKLESGDVMPAEFNNEFTVVLQRYCDVDISSLTGAYTQCYDDGSYGPYTINVLEAVSTGASTGYITVDNLWDYGYAATPIRINLDWTDPANFLTNIPTGQPLQPATGSYGQSWVRPVGNGSFSSCDNSFVLRYQVYVGAGSFAASTTVMNR